MPPRGLDRMRFSQLMQGLRGGGGPARFRGGNPDMEARNALLQQRRGGIGRRPGGNPAGGGMYTIQDMPSHPGVIWSKQQAQGPAQGAIDEITSGVYADLGEKGIYRDDSGTWHIDMAKNRAYRDAQNALTTPQSPPITSPGRPSVPGSTGSAIGSVRTLPTPPAGPQPGGNLGMPPTGGQPGAIGKVQTLPPGPASQSVTQPMPQQQPSGQIVNTNGMPQRGVPGNTVSGPAPSAAPAIGSVRTLPPGQASQRSITQPMVWQGPGGTPIPPQSALSQSPLPNQRGVSGNTASGPAPSPASSSRPGVNPTMVPGSGVYGQGQITPGLGGYPTMPAGQQPAPQQAPTIMRPAQPTMGPTQVPFNQSRDLSNLGNEIEMNVRNRLAQAGVGGPRRNPLEGMPGQPAGQPTLGQTIRDRVFGQLGMNQPPGIPGRPGQPVTPGRPGMPNMPQRPGMPNMPQQPGTPQPPQQPGVGTTPGGMPQPPQQPGTTPAPGETTPAPAPAGSIGSPQGTIGGNLQVAYGRGGSWDQVNQYDQYFVQYGQQYGVDPAMLKAMAVIESGGQMIPNQGGSGAYGIMQVKADIWGSEAARLGFDLNTPEGQIGFAAAFLGGAVNGVSGSTPEERFINSYYPTACMDCAGEDGATPRMYLNDMHELMNQINAANPGAGSGTPVAQGPGGTPLPPGDPSATKAANTTTPPAPGADSTAPIGPTNTPRIPVTTGTLNVTTPFDGVGLAASPDSDESWIQVAFPNGATISTEYKQQVTWAVPALGDCPYCYQNGHGADGTTHAGMDIAGNYGDPVATPVAGTVVCSGYGSGPGVPGFNCSYAIGPTFEDNNGPGQITLDVGTDAYGNQLLINTIHMGGSVVQPGQQLNPGDQIGTMGSMGGMVHTHIEGLAICNGNYIYLDPTLVYDGYYNDHNACEGF